MADTCNAGTLIRGAPPAAVRYRGIAPERLGIPLPERPAFAASDAWQTAAFDVEVPARPASRGAPEDNAAAPRTSDIAFYAARAGEPAPELPLPEGAADARPHGLLTRRLAEALEAAGAVMETGGRAIGYRQLAEGIRQRYAGRLSPTPLFDGPALDTPVLGAGRLDADAAAPQWRVLKQTHPAGVYLPVGRLAQIGPGTRLALLARPDDPADRALGMAEVAAATDLSAELRALASGSGPAFDLASVPEQA